MVGVGSDPVARELDGDRPRWGSPNGRSELGDHSAGSDVVPSSTGEGLPVGGVYLYTPLCRLSAPKVISRGSGNGWWESHKLGFRPRVYGKNVATK